MGKEASTFWYGFPSGFACDKRNVCVGIEGYMGGAGKLISQEDSKEPGGCGREDGIYAYRSGWRLDSNISYVNSTTNTNVLWTSVNGTEHMGEYVGRFGREIPSIMVRSQLMLEGYESAWNKTMLEIAEKVHGRHEGIYGNWELGINTSTGVVYHAKMLY